MSESITFRMYLTNLSYYSWDNTDASDASFMTPKRLDVLRMLLAHPDISLLTLNVPQSSMNGVIPLGMAAWLNMVDAVRVLLEDSAGMVSVDGMDSHGATALMCTPYLFLSSPPLIEHHSLCRCFP